MNIIVVALISISLLAKKGVAQPANPNLIPESGPDCHICGDAGDDGLLDDKPYCVELKNSLMESDVSAGYGKCDTYQLVWSRSCCKEIVSTFEDNLAEPGTYNACSMCPENEYPMAPLHRAKFLDLGTASCAQYWEAGLQGQIPAHLCDPIQFFLGEPCGCGTFSRFSAENNNDNAEDAVMSTAQQAQKANIRGGFDFP